MSSEDELNEPSGVTAAAEPDPAMEPLQPRRPARPASPLRVISVGVLLLLLIGATAMLARPPKAPITVEETEAELFDEIRQPLPYGLVGAEARRLPRNERMLAYVRPADAESVDGAVPQSITIIEYPASRAEGVLSDQFKKLRFESGDKGRGGGGRGRGGRRGGGGGSGGGPGGGSSSKPKLRDAGFMDWHGYRSNYARLRHSVSGEGEGRVRVRVRRGKVGSMRRFV